MMAGVAQHLRVFRDLDPDFMRFLGDVGTTFEVKLSNLSLKGFFVLSDSGIHMLDSRGL